MNIYHFLNLFFYFEILVLVLVFLFILVKRGIYFFSSRHDISRKKKLSDILSACLLKKEKCELIQKVHTKKLLLEVLETFNLRFSGEEWDLLKKTLCAKFLLPQARKWASKHAWIKRNLAARVFALSPLKQDEKQIIDLIDDNNFLVASIASSAGIKLQSAIGIRKILKKIAVSNGYEHFFYADLLSQGSSDIFNIIADTSSKNHKLHLALLDILALETTQIPLKFLSKDLKSHDVEIKKAALKVACRNPQDEWHEILLKDMQNECDDIRKLAADCLSNYPEKKSIKALVNGLFDENFNVKLASARSLKLLDKADLIKDQELKNYVLEFE